MSEYRNWNGLILRPMGKKRVVRGDIAQAPNGAIFQSRIDFQDLPFEPSVCLCRGTCGGHRDREADDGVRMVYEIIGPEATE